MTDNYITGVGYTTLSSQLMSVDFRERQATQKEKVEMWFIEPLKRMKEDDGFACLMICFPILEAIMHYELEIPDDQELPFSDNSPALHWFAKFMTIPDRQARDVWSAFRHGLLHRAMIKSDMPYDLTGEIKGRPAEFAVDRIIIYVWDLRNAVVAKLEQHHSKLWKSIAYPLPAIRITA